MTLMMQRQQVPDSGGEDAAGASKPSLEELRDALRRFAAERDWDQFHFPKNLAIALSVEAAELLEHFQWLPDLESAALPVETRAKIREELADVLLYLIRLADKLDIDLAAAAVDKMSINAKKYPIQKARGNSKKYTDL
jgi:dCTP diphosphatase